MDKFDEPHVRLVVHAENRLIREALSASLGGRRGLFVVAATATVEELQLVCVRHRPEVVLVDAAAGPLVVEALRRLHASSPRTHVIAVASAELSPGQVAAVARAAAVAIVSGADGLDAVLTILRTRGQPRATAGRPPAAARLTPGETRIVQLMGGGHSTPEIAEQLELRPRTVENHKRHIYAKLGVSSQSHAVARAISLGLLDSPGHPRAGAAAHHRALVVLHGPPGDCRDEVMRSLVAQGRPFVVVRARGSLDHERWAQWRRAPVTVVLVDPEPEDWALSTFLAAPTLVVRRSGTGDPSAIIDALAHGATGLVFRDDVARDLGPMLAVVGHGHLAMSAVFAATLARWAPPARRAAAPVLTARERDILGLIASGHTIRQTAHVLGIAAKTVENTQARLFRKLGARNRTETLTIADGWGLVDRKAVLAAGGTTGIGLQPSAN